MKRLYLWSLSVRPGNIGWTMAISGFMLVALMLASGGFLLSQSLGDEAAGTQMIQSSQPMPWQTVMKWLSYRLHHSAQE